MTAKYDPQQMRNRLLGVIERKGLSMREVSLGSGNSETYIYGVLKRGRDPQLGRLIRVCNFLNVSVTWALYGFDIPEGSDEIFQHLSRDPDLAEPIAEILRGKQRS